MDFSLQDKPNTVINPPLGSSDTVFQKTGFFSLWTEPLSLEKITMT